MNREQEKNLNTYLNNIPYANKYPRVDTGRQ